MSDGQIVTAFEEWRKVHDELSQLRDKLAEIRKKGGWMEGIPEEAGWYLMALESAPTIEPVHLKTLENGLMGVRWFNYSTYEELALGKGIYFARILTPEDLE